MGADGVIVSRPDPLRLAHAGISSVTVMPLDDQTTRGLSNAANKARAWTAKRNDLIRAAYEAGAGIREIAKATGLNVGTVHTMLHGRKR